MKSVFRALLATRRAQLRARALLLQPHAARRAALFFFFPRFSSSTLRPFRAVSTWESHQGTRARFHFSIDTGVVPGARKKQGKSPLTRSSHPTSTRPSSVPRYGAVRESGRVRGVEDRLVASASAPLSKLLRQHCQKRPASCDGCPAVCIRTT